MNIGLFWNKKRKINTYYLFYARHCTEFYDVVFPFIFHDDSIGRYCFLIRIDLKSLYWLKRGRNRENKSLQSASPLIRTHQTRIIDYLEFPLPSSRLCEEVSHKKMPRFILRNTVFMGPATHWRTSAPSLSLSVSVAHAMTAILPRSTFGK